MKISFIAAAAAVLVFSGPALAFYPLTGEDTLFHGRDGREIEGGLDYNVSKEGPDRYSTGVFSRLTYGLWDELDLMVTVPWQGWNSKGISESGLGDVLLEAKFQAGQRSGWTFAMKPGFSLPAGDEAKSLGAGEGGLWLYGIAGKARGPWQFYLNAGYMLNRNSVHEEEHLLKGSAAAGLKVLPDILVTAALTAETNKNERAHSHPVTSVFGLVWSPYATLDLDAGVKAGLNRSSDDFGLLAGMTLRI